MHIGIRKHRFGVNYTPTRSWWYCWNDFQEFSIARDLDSIAEIGADHIRIMLIWPYFQPNPQEVSPAHLDRLSKMMSLAEERHLDVCVALFVGWLSGYAFKPVYQQDGSFYALSESRKSQELYLRSVSNVVNQYANFMGFDLGNELNCCWQSERLDIGDDWSRSMLNLAGKCAPGGIHVNGVDHNPWFKPATFSPQHLAADQEIISLHCWTYFTGASERSGGDFLSQRCLRLPEAMTVLARSYAADFLKPVWVQEYGMSEEWMDADRIPEFLEASTLNAIQSGVNWFTWWCSHDLDQRYAFHPLEYSLGLITLDRKIKPQGWLFKELADAYRGKETIPGIRELPPPPDIFSSESTWQWLDHYLEGPGALDPK